MDKIILKAKELKAAIDQTSEMKEYLKNKECLENSQEVVELKHHIANLKAQGKLTEAHNLEEIYHAHSLVNNYELSREALCQLLKTIETIIK